jgi:hypothetical protein
MARDSTSFQIFYTAADVEGHQGTDGKFYLIDTARVFPPTAYPRNNRFGFPRSLFFYYFDLYVVDLEIVVKPKGVHLYRLFRPEFVKLNKVPLSSDALTKMGQGDEQKVDLFSCYIVLLC